MIFFYLKIINISLVIFLSLCYDSNMRDKRQQLICPICGRSFKRKKSAIERAINWFGCSDKCVRIAQRRYFDNLFFKKHGKTIEETIQQLYLIEFKSYRQICEIININTRTLMRRMKEFNIPIRDRSTAVKLQYLDPTIVARKAKTRRNHDDEWYKKSREGRSQFLQNNPRWSKYEIEANRFLAPLGFIHEIALGGYNFDFGHPSKKMIIEIDGGNWHDSAPKMSNDRIKTKILENLGWKLFRLQIKDIKEVKYSIKKLDIFN